MFIEEVNESNIDVIWIHKMPLLCQGVEVQREECEGVK